MPIKNRIAVAVVIGASAAALLAGCTKESKPHAEPSTTPPTSTSTGEPTPKNLEKFYNQKIEWGSCADYAARGEDLPSSFQCAHVTVPVDYDNPDGDTAKIAISKAEATGDRIGSVLFNPGGPGIGGLGLASQGKGTELAKRFDRIGFDPRGVGASTPTVRCLTDKEVDAERADLDIDETPAGIAETEQEEKDYVAKCDQRVGKNLLAHLGTREVVRDMDIIRGALGDEKLNYVGYSYGTRIGSEYAETFPTRIRAMVLDGAVDPEQDPLVGLVAQYEGFQKAFDAYAAKCAKSASCPLGTDPANAVKAFRALVDPLIDKPAKTDDPRGLGYGDAQTGVIQALYSTEIWDALTQGLTELKAGRGDTLLKLADLYEGRNDDGTYSNADDAFKAIRCVDDPPITDRAAVGKANLDVRKVAPFLDDGRGTGQSALDECAFWPVPNTGKPHSISVTGLPKVVVVSTTEDPATPYQAGVDLARQLGASLITYDGTQHTVALSGVPCVDDAVIAYLTDLTSPPEGLRC